MNCCICPNPATSIHQWVLQGECLRYPFCQECHQKTWNKTSPATQFILTASIFPVDPIALAINIGDINDPLLGDPNVN